MYYVVKQLCTAGLYTLIILPAYAVRRRDALMFTRANSKRTIWGDRPFFGEGIFAKSAKCALYWGVAKTINVLGFTSMYYNRFLK